MQIQVRSIAGDTFDIEDIDPEANVLELKYRIEKSLGVLSRNQRLIFCGKELLDNDTLQSYGVAERSVVQMMIRPAMPIEVAAGEDWADNVAVNLADNVNPGGENRGVPNDHFEIRQHFAQVDERASAVVALAQTVKLFVIVDAAVTWFTIFTLQVNFVPLLIFALLAPLVGFAGVRYLRIDILVLYASYLMVNITIRCIYAASIISARPFDTASQFVQMFMDVLILLTLLKLIYTIRKQPSHDLYLLRRGLHPCQLRVQ